MNTKTENPKSSLRPKSDPFANTERDEGTLGVTHSTDADPGLAEGDQPTWQPPESIPEPRPADPIMNPTQQSNQSTNTNSPA